MKNTLVTRNFTPDFEVRSSSRTIAGLAVPFGTITDLGHEREFFVRGSFARTIAERGVGYVKLLAQHGAGGGFAIGKATVLREDAAGLYAEFAVANTRDGTEALELASSGVVDGLSVGFVVVRDDYPEHDLRAIHEAKLREISLVNFAQYPDAKVLSVRAAEDILNNLEGDTGLHQIELAERQMETLI